MSASPCYIIHTLTRLSVNCVQKQFKWRDEERIKHVCLQVSLQNITSYSKKNTRKTIIGQVRVTVIS